MKKITVACVLRTPPDVGNEGKQKNYSEIDVLRLKQAFEKFLTIEHNFVCLSDRKIDGVDTILLIGETPGWWAKIELFRPNLFKTPVFYIDLDMIVCDQLDNLIEQCYGNKFLMYKNPKVGTPASGLMYWEGEYSELWNLYTNDPAAIQHRYRKKPKIGDQAFISDNVKYAFFVDIENIKTNWFHTLKFNTIPHPESKILICIGLRNKLHRREYNDHPWVNKFWRNV